MRRGGCVCQALGEDHFTLSRRRCPQAVSAGGANDRRPVATGAQGIRGVHDERRQFLLRHPCLPYEDLGVSSGDRDGLIIGCMGQPRD